MPHMGTRSVCTPQSLRCAHCAAITALQSLRRAAPCVLQVRDPANQLKLLVDWFILAQSTALLGFGGSAFAVSASLYAAASSPEARQLTLLMPARNRSNAKGAADKENVDGDAFWRDRCQALKLQRWMAHR